MELFEKELDRLFAKASGMVRGGLDHSQWQSLNENEIRKLEDNGCSSDDWSKVFLASGSMLDRVRGCRFSGRVRLSLRSAEIHGRTVEPLILDSTLDNVDVGPGCVISRTGLIRNLVLLEGVEISNCCSLTFREGSSCGAGTELQLGVETGERSVPSFMLLDVDMAAGLSRGDGRGDKLRIYRDRLFRFIERDMAMERGILARGCTVRDTPSVTDSYLGPECVISCASAVRNSTLLGEDGFPARVSDGALVRNSILKWGCHVDSMAIVEDSIVGEASVVERHGKLFSSFLGPNSVLAEGEITASLVGPFTSAHHQSLLIAASWPEGRGNIGYGANVGSNHTSRLPDQEIRPGEGMFFGLDCSVKYPADYSGSPYSILATGITTLPQKVIFPFSLICEPFRNFSGMPPAYNQIVPAWVLSDNMFAVKRNGEKYRGRNRARHWSPLHAGIIREETVMLMMDALKRLDVDEVKELYTQRDIDGLGKNFLTEEHRLRAIETYRFHMRLHALHQLNDDGELDEQESLAAAIIRSEFPDTSPEDLLSIRAEMRRQLEEAVLASRSKDSRRGAAIIDDYLQVRE